MNKNSWKNKIDKIYGDLKAKKRGILDDVLKTIPEHSQTRAKRICDSLKGKDACLFYLMGRLTLMEKLFLDPTYIIWSCRTG